MDTMDVNAYAIAGVATLSLVACIWDLRSGRIPNVLTLPAAGAGLLFGFAGGGWQGLANGLGGLVVGVALLLPFFALGGLGAGDVKLLGAVGAWMGLPDTLWIGLYGAAAGGVMAVALAVAHGYLWTAIANLSGLLGYWRTAGPRAMPELTLARARGPRLPYALPIAAGVVMTLWLR